MKKGITYVDAADIQGLIEAALGAPLGTLVELGAVKAQKGFVQVDLGDGKRLYVGATKAVGRLDLSGFEMPGQEAGVERLGEDGFGRVREQVRFEGTREEILATIERVLLHGIDASTPAFASASSKGGSKSTARGWSFAKVA